jgi:hypothetical protein
LAGPLPATAEGHQYFVCFIDDCTRFAEVYLLKNKSDAMDAFIQYKTWIERTTLLAPGLNFDPD